LSLIFTLAAIVLILYLLVIIIVPRFSAGIQNIIKTIEANWDKIVEFCNNLGLDASRIKNLMNQIDTPSIIGFAGENVKNILKTVISTASSVYGVLFTAIISVVCCVYILYGQKKLASQCSRVIKAYFSPKAANGIINTSHLFWETFKNFLSRQCLEALILGTLLTIAMLIFRVPYALVVGCVTAVLALIPYVGAFVSFGAGAVLILLTEPSKLIVFVILFLVIQQIEGNVIYPHIVGRSVGLPAIWTLMAVYAGGELFGVVGMFMFVPIVSVIYTLIKQDVAKRNEKRQTEVI
ncbi:MAG: AI-2E family transporter, partial [Clostridia bacterium]|nr:AI-2E family transporter [Clostridia bacterium]